ncbi:antibiotic biosynthesis monooxygenase [Paramagnetospirillum kuznetsovii]|uniref:Antibiotic biosynthesis monooxygenase n=1 Tax=Paramagnetospirillum kuznetsovii TaxID=2053833 RepID=A0A364NZ72_9PROT|nr:antibiotic biosynthesis monooxygenase [Paramagnetospirillum kuznetsovii]RAU22343.1 antibiotic biosynthesis monooxygenase [Paramagnetospirillum kuznetsovii]
MAHDEEGPVTVSIARRIKPGCERDYEAWVSGITTEASSWPGYQGVNVLRPAPSTDFAYVTIYRFESWRHCHAFEVSDARRHWLDRIGDIVEGEASVKKVTGLEFWFDLPEVPVEAKPSPHKMALVITVVAYGVVLGLNLTFGGLVAGLPLWLKALIFVSAQVLIMTYLVMPRVTRLLRPWLYGA